jgi:hypothetical protein
LPVSISETPLRALRNVETEKWFMSCSLWTVIAELEDAARSSSLERRIATLRQATPRLFHLAGYLLVLAGVVIASRQGSAAG